MTLNVSDLLDLIEELTDPDPCDYDHNGNCQGHNMTGPPPCPHARAKELLKEFVHGEEREQVREAVSDLFIRGSQMTVEEHRQAYPLAFACFKDNPDRFWSYLKEFRR